MARGAWVMEAYSSGITKEQFVNETKKHREMDAFLRGTYSNHEMDHFRGCAVGCALQSVNNIKGLKLQTDIHSYFEEHLGVPEWLARLEDSIFENLPKDKYKDWPVKFAEAINEGSDLNQIKSPFIIYLLKENLKTLDSLHVDAEHAQVINAIRDTYKATEQMIAAHESGDEEKLSAAESAAWSARSAAESAARSAAESAAWSAWSAARSAAESAWSAARSAAESARSAARSAAESARSAARSAAESAAWSAWSAAESAAESAAWSAWSAAFEKHSEKLLELMRECK